MQAGARRCDQNDVAGSVEHVENRGDVNKAVGRIALLVQFPVKINQIERLLLFGRWFGCGDWPAAQFVFDERSQFAVLPQLLAG